jgi:alpha-methylacyl-CoA racemase
MSISSHTSPPGLESPAATRARGVGPLAGIKVLEIESIGPGPFAAMLLADLGANVLRIARLAPAARRNPVLGRGRAGTLELDLKSNEGRERLLDLLVGADALIEGYRPGVMERLNLSPDICLSRNPRLIYGRITGWGRAGPLAHSAGHDINYIALTGALHACGTAQSGPVPPLNLVGDFGGGGLLLAFGLVSALLEAKSSGRGQVVDAAMIDGAGLLMSMIYGLKANGRWQADRAGNILDGSAYFYRCYACADDQWMAVGAIEPAFRLLFLQKLALGEEAPAIMRLPDDDPDIQARIAAIFRSQPRTHWQEIFAGSDACVSPVLSMNEVDSHPHNQAWGSFKNIDGVIHPMPAPRFGRSGVVDPQRDAAITAGQLAQWGLDASSLTSGS